MSARVPLGFLFLLVVPLASARSQEQDLREWDAARVTRLVERAIERRAAGPAVDSLIDFHARAQGHVYFLFDVGRDTKRQLVKADQVALEIYWRAPGESRQVFVGRREQKTLPTDIIYHIDHLTVALDNFADSISLGESSEVDDIIHPLAPSAPSFYEYRLADSLSLVLPDRELWLERVEVRPRDTQLPGVVGSLFIDRESGHLARMQFTFTKASYIDPQLDFINVQIENALWESKYWLPHRQGLELRREIDALAFPAGGVIRAEVRIVDYDINRGVPDRIFRGPPVVTLPDTLLDAHAFEAGLFDALDPDVATQALRLESIQEEATHLVARSKLQRIENFRLAVPGISSVVRFRRAEGLYLGPGIRHTDPGLFELTALAGYAIGADRFELEGAVRVPFEGSADLEIRGYLDRVRDLSPWSASSGVVASLAALADGEDYREPYWTSGGSLTAGWRWPGLRASATVAWEEWRSAELVVGDTLEDSYRSVRPMSEGDVTYLSLRAERPALNALETIGGLSWDVGVEGAASALAGDFEYARLVLRVDRLWPDVVGRIGLRLSGETGGVVGSAIPAQRLFLGGGRGSVRGYEFHRFAGDAFAFGHAALRRSLWFPFVSLVLFSDVGWIGFGSERAQQVASIWPAAGSSADEAHGPLVGVGAGLGLFFDILQLEWARGLTQDGKWEVVVRVTERFWDWL